MGFFFLMCGRPGSMFVLCGLGSMLDLLVFVFIVIVIIVV